MKTPHIDDRKIHIDSNSLRNELNSLIPKAVTRGKRDSNIEKWTNKIDEIVYISNKYKDRVSGNKWEDFSRELKRLPSKGVHYCIQY